MQSCITVIGIDGLEAVCERPVRWKGRLVQYAGRILRLHPGKSTAEIHYYHDHRTGVLAATLVGRAPGYTSLAFRPAADPADAEHEPVTSKPGHAG